MSDYQEFTGKSVEDALRQAREAFGGLGLDELDFEILTPGSRGVLGMGAEPARIVAAPRAAFGGAAPKREAAAERPLAAPAREDRPPRAERPPAPARDEPPPREDRPPRSAGAQSDRGRGPRRADAPSREERPARLDRASRPAGPPPDRGRGPRREARPTGENRASSALSDREQAQVSAARASMAVEREEIQAAEASPEALAAGQEILAKLMELLGYEVKVTIESGMTSKLNVTAEGDEKEALGALIGRKGERLSALQHLVNLMLSRRMGAWTRVLVDVEEYRGRRERQLVEIANRAAERVIETGKMLQLEPMPPLERRWIHLALRGRPGVATQSIGEEPNRRIVVLRTEG